MCHNLQELRDNYVNMNEEARRFLADDAHNALTPEVFEAFIGEYALIREHNTHRSSAFSERVLAYWTVQGLGAVDFTVRPQQECRVPLLPRGDENHVNKHADLFITAGDRSLHVEFKCNIDNIEKDLYKFYLLSANRANEGGLPERILVVWEQHDRWRDRHGQPSSYARLLEDTKQRHILTDYFYLAPANQPEEFATRIEKYGRFLGSWGRPQ